MTVDTLDGPRPSPTRVAAEARETMPLVSIVIRTVRGREALLRRAVASVLAQRYRAVEIVVVEDGGGRSQEALEGLSGLDGFALKILSCAKVGRCEAGNLGVAAAQGEYVNFLDDDDELLPNHAGLLSAALLGAPDTEVAYAASFQAYSDVLGLDPLVIEEHRRDLFGRHPFDLAALWERNRFPIQAVMFRKSLFERLGGFCKELDALEDWDLWLRYSAERDFLYVDAATSRFRVAHDPHELGRRRDIHMTYMPLARKRQAQLLDAYRGSPFAPRLEAAARTAGVWVEPAKT